MGPTPAVAAVRLAVREALAQLPSGSLALAACSGGADSVALAAALAFEAPRANAGLRAGGVTVDHGLQTDSATRAAAVVRLLRELGLDPVDSVAVEVTGPGGPEAAARAARYSALDAVARDRGAAAVLLGHTLDDQAETVLLGLARGSGLRSRGGVGGRSGGGGRYRRPLLGLSRATTRAACAQEGLPVWDDPHNIDPAYARVRVRADVLPVLEAQLGPGVAEALARTAALARDDADALDSWAQLAFDDLRGPRHAAPDVEFDVAELAALPSAIRRRVLRLAALAAGSPAGALGSVHVAAVDTLVTEWKGQGVVSLPGGRTAARRYGRLYFRGAGEAGGPGQGRGDAGG